MPDLTTSTGQKKKKQVIILLLVLALSLIAGIGFWLLVMNQKQPASVQPRDIPTSASWRPMNSVWGGRDSHCSVVYQDKLWVLGGKDKDGLPTNDVWSSADGSLWLEVTSSAPWPARWAQACAVFEGSIYLMGGTSDELTMLHDIWMTSNGQDWTEVAAAAPWPSRANFACLTYQGALWVMGGWTRNVDDSLGYFNDVWSSDDGMNWNQITGDADWPPQAFLSTTVFNQRTYLMSGATTQPSSQFDEVWSSRDGVAWTQTGSLPSPRFASAAVVQDNLLYLIGGYNLSSVFDDVLVTDDGTTWREVDTSTGLLKRAFHTAAWFQDKIWSLGGTDFSTGRHNDVWYMN